MSARERPAWHEGGHLAGGWIVGARLIRADIKRAHWRSGQAEMDLPIGQAALEAAWWSAALGEPIDAGLRDGVERTCLMLLAGPITEARAETLGHFSADPPDPSAPAERRRYLAAINSGEPEPPL